MAINKHCLWQFGSYRQGLKLRKSVTNERVHVSPGLASVGEERVGCHWNIMLFFGLLLGGANVEKRGDDQEKKFFL